MAIDVLELLRVKTVKEVRADMIRYILTGQIPSVRKRVRLRVVADMRPMWRG